MKTVDEREPRQYYKQLLYRILVVLFIISIVPVTLLGYISMTNLNALASESKTNTDKLAEESISNTNNLAQSSKSNTDTLAEEIYQNNAEELNQQAISDFQLYIADKSREWDLFFQYMKENVAILQDYAADLFTSGSSVGSQPEVYDSDANLTNQLLIDRVSVYHLVQGINRTPQIEAKINLTANMDYIYQYIKNNNPYIQWIYLGTPDGLFRSFPWHKINPLYDNRIRPWYIAAKDETEPIWTSPYLDAS